MSEPRSFSWVCRDYALRASVGAATTNESVLSVTGTECEWAVNGKGTVNRRRAWVQKDGAGDGEHREDMSYGYSRRL